MFLEYGINDTGRYVHISQVTSGRVPLVCPYCNQGLIARKGRVKQHHFAHDGETCRESERDFEALSLPLFDKFNTHIDGKTWQALQRFHSDMRGYDLQLLERAKLIQFNHFSRVSAWELVNPDGMIPFGLATLDKFQDFQLGKIYARHNEIADIVRRSHYGVFSNFSPVMIQPPAPDMTPQNIIDLNIYRSQVARAFNLDLYLLEINNKLYKIGVTSDIDRRLSEIRNDLSKLMSIDSINVLRLCKRRGAVERYALFRYKDYSKPLATLTEYFEFDKSTRRKVLSDFTRLGDFDVLQGDERYRYDDDYHANGLVSSIMCNDMSDIELAVNDDIVKANISKGTRRGMAKAKARGVHVGRPTQDESDVLDNYPEVVKAINEGLSLRATAKQCGVSVNTVRKVKAVIINAKN